MQRQENFSDVLRAIVDKVKDGRTLKSLSLVSKQLHSLAAPNLFNGGIALSDKHVPLLTSNSEVSRLLQLPHLSVVLSLRITMSGEAGDLAAASSVEHHFRPVSSIEQHLNGIICRIILALPQLKSFQWDYGFILLQSTLNTLKKACTGLESLNLNFSDEMEGEICPPGAMEVHMPQCEICDEEEESQPHSVNLTRYCFAGFQNLRSLSLETLFGNARDIASDIADILIASPVLEELALSISSKTVDLHAAGWYPGAGLRDIACFLQQICESYHARGGSPLRIRHLELGSNVLLWESFPELIGSRNWKPENIGQLLDLSALESLDMYNVMHPAFDAMKKDETTQPNGRFATWAFFDGDIFKAPNLKSITIERLDSEMIDLIKCVAGDESLPPSCLSDWEVNSLSEWDLLTIPYSHSLQLPEWRAVSWPRSLKIHCYESFRSDDEDSDMEDSQTAKERPVAQVERFPTFLASIKGLKALTLGISEEDLYLITSPPHPPILLPEVTTFHSASRKPQDPERYRRTVLSAFPNVQI